MKPDANFMGLMACLAVLSISHLSAAERVAFVIGNDAYENAPALDNPVNDATAVGEKLKAAGYEVTVLKDAGVRDMMKGLRTFCESARGADAAVFYFAGHGIEVKGENYLIPVDAELVEEVDLDLETLSLEKVLEDIGETGARLKVMVLDCCRDNPLQSTRGWMNKTRSLAGGLAEVNQDAMAEGTMLVFAAAPGKPALDSVGGQHSPFTAALLREMESPGQSVAGVFSRVAIEVSAQEPWIRFDGSGKSFAAFNTYPLISKGAVASQEVFPPVEEAFPPMEEPFPPISPPSSRSSENTNAGNRQQFVTTNSQAILNGPSDWEHLDLNHPDSVLEVGNLRTEEYCLVIAEPKTSFQAGFTLEAYTDIVSNTIINNLTDVESSELQSVSTNGLTGLRHTIAGEIEGIRVAYVNTYIEGEQNFYQLVMWSLESMISSKDPIFRSTADTFFGK